MATIDTDEKFALAAFMHPETHIYQGQRYVDKTARKIFDQIADPDPEAPPGKILDIDVTPSQAVMEAALDAALTGITQEDARRVVRDQAHALLKGPLIAALLQSIADDQADITTDAASVNNLAVLTLVAFKPLMLRLYARQTRILNKLDMVIKVLSHE